MNNNHNCWNTKDDDNDDSNDLKNTGNDVNK